ncbi:MAG: Ig-like domain-containing protein, partial [Clostridia bacterium]|nr:Ig-like domain-containing protein [Clostridia bacterium]
NIESGTLSGIIVTELPDTGQGRLKISGDDVQLYETIGRDGLNRLFFQPEKGCAQTSFCFIPLVPGEDDQCDEMCIAMLDKANQAPGAEGDDLATQENLTVGGSFRVTDEDMDSLTIRIVDKPQKGGLTLSGLNYTYEPYLGMSGNDSFTFEAVDRYGAASQAEKVSVSIEKPSSAISYADMEGNPNEYAALKLMQLGLAVGEKMGKNYYFRPDEAITKGDFLVMLTAVCGREDNLAAAVNTGLKNDSAIPMYLKPYVENAKRLGIIGGQVCGSSFDASAALGKTEAVCMIRSAAQIPDATASATVFRDSGVIPSWAASSYLAVYKAKIMGLSNGYAKPDEKVTRGEAAGLLWNLKTYLDA